jgi:hypothetical protein
VAAANLAFSGQGAFIDDAVVKLESGDVDGAKKALALLQDLNTRLIEAVPAGVTPESAGTVGKSRRDQALDLVEKTIRENMTKMAEIVQNISVAGEHMRVSAQACAEGKIWNNDNS